MNTGAEEDQLLQDYGILRSVNVREIPETPAGTQDISDHDTSPVKIGNVSESPGELVETNGHIQHTMDRQDHLTAESDQNEGPTAGISSCIVRNDEDTDDDELLFAPERGIATNCQSFDRDAVADDTVIFSSSSCQSIPNRTTTPHDSSTVRTKASEENLGNLQREITHQHDVASSEHRLADEQKLADSTLTAVEITQVGSASDAAYHAGGLGIGNTADNTKATTERNETDTRKRFSASSNVRPTATPGTQETQVTDSFTTSASTQQYPSPTKPTAVQSRFAAQQATIDTLEAERDKLLRALASLPGVKDHLKPGIDPKDMDKATAMAAATSVTKRHIKLLHEYNEMRDIGMGLMGLIADSRGVRIKEVQEEFGIETKD